MVSLLESIPPAEFGLPERFLAYRPGQIEAIDHVISAFTDGLSVVAVCAPTGLGKSLLAMTIAMLLGVRAVYLTATKGLQTQILGDFSPSGLVDIRGRANYSCRLYKKLRLDCEQGFDRGCSDARTLDCPYFSAYTTACASDLVSTNYAYWLATRAHLPNALGDVGLVVCDEAHEIPELLASYLRITVLRQESREVTVSVGDSGLMSDASGARWKQWAEERRQSLARGLVAFGDQAEKRESEQEIRRLGRISAMDSNWTWEAQDDEVSFDPIRVAPYASSLWSGVPRILLLSATLRPYSLGLLGLDPGACAFAEFDNGWPPQYAPVYHIPTCRLNYASTDDDYRKMTDAIDGIIESRLDRKGIIHTVSYDRMKRIMALSRWSHVMLANDRGSGAVELARRFRRSDPPAVLISPSFSSGWDFPYRQCEYQILPKTPYPPAQSRVMRERLADPHYRSALAMMETVQAIGRARRYSDDRSETFLLDNCFPWLAREARSSAPRRFRIYSIAHPPPPPPRAPDKS